MNKVEIEGIVYKNPKLVDINNAKRAIIIVQTVDEKNYKTTFPVKAWRENAEKIMNLHENDKIHFIGKITRYKPKDSESWVTDIEVTEIL